MTPTSRRVLHLLIAVPSVGVALLAALVAPRGTIVGALVIVILTPFVVLSPSSRLTMLLLTLHSVNWLSSTGVPAGLRDWALTFLVALALLSIHLAAALAAALPPSAPLSRATVHRWARRTLTVIGLSVPVWAVLVTQTYGTPAGIPLLTYAAVASLAILTLALWLAHAQDAALSTPGQEPRPEERR